LFDYGHGFVVPFFIFENKYMSKFINIKCASHALGDTLACVPVVDYYRKVYSVENINFDCAEWLWSYLSPVYPFLNFCKIDNPDIVIDYHFDLPVQKGFAYDLFQIPKEMKYDFHWEFIEPKIFFEPKPKYIMNEYFTFSIHSTAQVKYWNSGSRAEQSESPRWRDLCLLLHNIGIQGVMVDKHYGFGNAPHWNEPPKNCKVVIGRPFDEVLNTIYHSKFYVGLSSGLSWVALALGKKTCMIAPWTYPDNEFGESNENHIRVKSNSHCTDCWTKYSVQFDKNDWYWCPQKKDTTEEFICSSSISAKDVFQELKNYKWI